MSGKRVRAVKRPASTFVAAPDEGITVEVGNAPDVNGVWWADVYMDLPNFFGLEAHARVRSLEGVVQVTELTVAQGHAVLELDENGAPILGIPTDTGGGVTTAALRDVPVARMLLKARAALDSAASQGELNAASAEAFRDNPRVGRAGRSAVDYARFAASYVDWCTKSATPVKDMAAAEFLDASTVRNILYEARERGLLSSSGRGKAGGTLTAAARELLKELENGAR